MSAFGSGGGFGSGSGGLFGNSGSGFGSNNNNNNTTSGFGGFGNSNSNNTSTGGGLFGSNAGTNNTGGGFGSFPSTKRAFSRATPGESPASPPGITPVLKKSRTATNAQLPANQTLKVSITDVTHGSSGFGANNNNNNNASGGLFGSANRTGGGLFGSNTASNTTGGFGSGGFGSNTANTTSAFGASNNAGGGGGLFGSANNNTTSSSGFGSGGGGGLFGSNNNATTQSSGFGSGTSTAFGGTSSAFGAGSTNTAQNQGTPPTFTPYQEKDTTGQNQNFNAISCVQNLQGFSLEELRLQDYQLGKKFGNQNGQAGAFGQSTGFGSGSTFGSQNNASTTNNAFGSNTGGGLFGGNNQQASTGGAFGSAAGGFGSNNNNNAFGANKPAGLFGSNNTSSQPAGGLFGSSGTNNAFGSNNNTTTNTGGGLFGSNNNNNQAKPGGLFGGSTGGFGSTPANNNTGGGLFGAQNNSTNNAFGQNNTNNNQQQSGGLFGSGGGSSFGQNNQQQNTNTGGGLFGGSFGANNQNNNNQQSGGLFGAKPAGTTPGGGLFGAQNNQTQQNNAGGGLFGGLNNNQNNNNTSSLFNKPAATGGGLFGASQPQQQSGGLFGSSTQNNSGGGLFGANNNNQAKPSLFGGSNNNSTGGGLFGGASQNNGQNQGQSLFGANTSNQNNQSTFGSSLLGGSQQNQGQQALTTSVLSPHPYGNVELFASVATPNQSTGPLATPLSSSQKNRKPAPLPQWKINPAASSRLLSTPQNGRSTYQLRYSQYGTPGSAYGSPSIYGGSVIGTTPSTRLGKSLSTSNLRTSESVLNPDAFSPSRSFRGGSIKKLHINRNLRTDLFSPETDNFKSSPLKKNVSFDGDQAQIANHASGESSQALVRVDDQASSATPSARDLGFLRSSAREKPNGATSTMNGADRDVTEVRGNELPRVPEDDVTPARASAPSADLVADHQDKTPGQYYMRPSKAEIQKMSRQQRKALEGFVVGRHNVGRVEFSTAVNLDGIDLDDICGGIVKLEVRRIEVYSDPLTKAPEGKGLNVPARVWLENSWPRAKGGALPVYESKGKRFEKHVSRLNKIGGTTFVEYDAEKGIWVFDVPHFSAYELDYKSYGKDEERNALQSSILSSVPDSPTPARGASGPGGFAQQTMFSSSGSSSNVPVDDTFEFRSARSSGRSSGRNLPGAFDDEYLPEELLTNNTMGSSLSSHVAPAALQNTDTDMEVTQHSEQLPQSPAPQTLGDNSMELPSEGPRYSPTGAASVKPKSILKTTQRTFMYSSPPDNANTGDWAERLQRTLSPKKQDRNVLRQSQGAILRDQRVETQDNNTFGTSLDIMRSLFGGDAVINAKKQSSDGKGFKIPDPKRPKTKTPSEGDLLPTWTAADVRDTSDPTVLDINNDEGVVAQECLKILQRGGLYHELFPAPGRLLDAQRKFEQIEIVDNVPYAQFPESSTLSFKVMVEAVSAQLASSPTAANARLLQEEKHMWELAAILFDGSDSAQHADTEDRKEKLMDLWAEVTKSRVKSQLDAAKTAEERAIIYLTGRDSFEASQTLIQGRDFRLAALVAQIGAGPLMREDVALLIDQWRKTNTYSDIVPRIRAIYELLAGQTCFCEATVSAGLENRMERINFSSAFNLNWRQSFGLKLWYGTLPNDSIADAVLRFVEDLNEEPEQIRPVPWFVEEKQATGWKDPNPTQRNDALWSLLQIFAAVRGHDNAFSREYHDSIWEAFPDFISPEATVGNPMDYRLTFQLYFMLAGNAIMDFDEFARDDKADKISTNFAFQLSTTPTQLCNAVWVALHLTKPSRRAEVVKLLLTRHADTIGEDRSCSVYNTLADELKIPETWLWDAKAASARSKHDAPEEMRCLLRAAQSEAAHDILKQAVGPRAVIEEDFDALRTSLADFEAHGAQALSSWSIGGNLYRSYCEMISAKGARRIETASDLLGSLPHADASGLGLEERAAVWEMRNVALRSVKEAGSAFGRTVDGDVERFEEVRIGYYERLRMGTVGA